MTNDNRRWRIPTFVDGAYFLSAIDKRWDSPALIILFRTPGKFMNFWQRLANF